MGGAPAFAASRPCRATSAIIDWTKAGAYVRQSATSGTYTLDPDGTGTSITLTVTNTVVGSNTNLGSQKFNGIPVNDGGIACS